ncbi:T9SS type A sorting domain-containing protein [Zhouia spongiae]|uniref:T9SS type A sorting domain-containing protein n=1 Tax=Zhouia spongiae TaxID=2202721 RepID=A0ABY3YQX7_9FLAO|nr:T9SS type A sorting domain-containing protein [Zhouia spongiae]UNZ00107.1 T9SS type A sorting domain-containing protein [Zhouia spongiae]
MKKLYTFLIFCMFSFISYSLNVAHNDMNATCAQKQMSPLYAHSPSDIPDILKPNSGVANEIDGFKLYPNPVKNGKVYISSDKNLPKQITIYDVLGKVVMKEKLNTKALNVSDLNKGVYILKVVEDDRATTRKLVVE